VLEKFGNAVPSDIKKAEVSSVKIGSLSYGTNYVSESFAPAMFKNMQDSDKLSAPSYELMKSGIKVTETDNIVVDSKSNRKVEYEVKVSDFDPTPKKFTVNMNMLLMRRMAKGGAVGRSPLSRQNAYSKIKQAGGTATVDQEAFVIVNKANRNKVNPAIFTQGSYSEAMDMVNNLKAGNPLADIQAVPAYHFEMA
jgi:hypothetical protein